MKKITTLIFAMAFCAFTLKAQLTLTKAFNEPHVGEVGSIDEAFDSVIVMPQNTGQNQTWNFSSIIKATPQNTQASCPKNFVAASSVPSSSLFPGANLVGADFPCSNDFGFMKTSTSPTTQIEHIGNYRDNAGSISITTFTNTLILFIWPVSYGYNKTDTYAAQTSGASSGSFSGTVSVKATGTGTLILPGGQIFTNVLQLKTVQTQIYWSTTPLVTMTFQATGYAYFHASQKYALLSASYSSVTMDNFPSQRSGGVSMNKNVVVVIPTNTQDMLFSISPNPANDNFIFSLSNPNNQKCSVIISNSISQELKTLELGNQSNFNEQINVSNFSPGIYFVKIILGENTQIKKILIE